jgi:chromosome segregation ATPase
MIAMKLANPLSYPLAVLAGGITLVVGVRFVQISSRIVIPVASGIAIIGASFLKSREPESFNLENPELARELQVLRNSSVTLVNQVNSLRLEANKLLTDAFQMELLAAIQISCDRAQELPAKIDNLAKRLQSSNSLLSVNELQQQLSQVQQKIPSSSGMSKQHLTQLAKSLKRNIQLAQEGQDTRLAQVVNISTLIQDASGVLQQLQNKLHSFDLTDSEQLNQLQEISDELIGLGENIDLLVRK